MLMIVANRWTCVLCFTCVVFLAHLFQMGLSENYWLLHREKLFLSPQKLPCVAQAQVEVGHVGEQQFASRYYVRTGQMVFRGWWNQWIPLGFEVITINIVTLRGFVLHLLEVKVGFVLGYVKFLLPSEHRPLCQFFSSLSDELRGRTWCSERFTFTAHMKLKRMVLLSDKYTVAFLYVFSSSYT